MPTTFRAAHFTNVHATTLSLSEHPRDGRVERQVFLVNALSGFPIDLRPLLVEKLEPELAGQLPTL